MDGEIAVRNRHESAAGDRDRGRVCRGEKLVALETLDAERRVGRLGIFAARVSGLQLEAIAPNFI